MLELKKGTDLYKSVSWVAKAISKDDDKSLLTYLYSDNGWITGCNGYQLHRFKIGDGFDDGFYRIFRTNKALFLVKDDKFNAIYPRASEIIPKDLSLLTSLGFLYAIDSTNISLVVAKIVRSGVVINIDYLKCVLSSGGMECFIENKQKPIYFRSEDREAVIMPVNDHSID